MPWRRTESENKFATPYCNIVDPAESSWLRKLKVHTGQIPLLVAKTTMGAKLDSKARLRKVKHSMSSICTSSINKTPGINSATPCSMYLFTTCIDKAQSNLLCWPSHLELISSIHLLLVAVIITHMSVVYVRAAFLLWHFFLRLRVNSAISWVKMIAEIYAALNKYSTCCLQRAAPYFDLHQEVQICLHQARILNCTMWWDWLILGLIYD